MKEIRQIAAWLAATGAPHSVEYVESLPGPTFRANGREQVSFSTNNYLALASSPRLIAAARAGLERYGVGNCESRLLGGNLEIYDMLERKLAALKQTESAILFATGYLTNLGVLSSIPRIGQYARIYGYRAKSAHSYGYFSDEFNHLSIREGIRMSGAERNTFKHRDLDHLETLLRKSQTSSRIIVTDGVFSQDGDIADLPGLLALAERYDALVYVDDAHGTGVLGANGGGISEHFGVKSPRLIQMGTLSKAYGAIGGFVATDAAMTDLLRLGCSAYGFTSTLPPDQAMAVSEALDAVVDEPERRARLWDNQRYFISQVKALPYRLVSESTPIVPILIGGEAETDRIAAQLQAEGIHVDAVKFPAVPLRKARLRIQLNAGHTHAQIDRLVDILEHIASGGPARPASVPRVYESHAPSAGRPWTLAAFQAFAGARGRLHAAAASLRDVCAPLARRVSGWARSAQQDLGTSLNLVTLATAILVTVDLTFSIPHLIFAYLLPILFVARKFGRTAALVATAVSAACAAFLMYEPVLSFYIEDGNDLLELSIFCALAAAIAQFLSTSDGALARARR